jgi:serine/threonine-protein kinase
VSGRVAGRYTLVETLGGGGTSVVHRAAVDGGQPDVAIKQLRPQFAADPMLRRRFLREAELARTLDSPHIVPILDAGEDQGVPFLVMELMRGETLRRRLERERRLPEDVARGILFGLGLGLEHAHGRGLIHRDIKPENVFLTDDGPKLGDFGNARVVSLASVTGASLTWGTPEYAAPEVFMRGRADPRSDLYSLGVVLYEMLAGRLPWSRSATLARLAGDRGAKAPPPEGVSDNLAVLIADLLAFSPADRPASVEEIFSRLSVAAPLAQATAGTAVVIAARCAACGAPRPNDVPQCLSCGHQIPRLAHDPDGGWEVVLDSLDDDPAATEHLLGTLDPIAQAPDRTLQFLTGRRDLYSDEEKKSGIALPAVLFTDLDAETARALESLFRRDGLEVRAVEGRPIARSIRGWLRGDSPKRTIAVGAPVLALSFVYGHAGHSAWLGIAVSGGLGIAVGLVLGVGQWLKKRRDPAPRLGVFDLRKEIASGPLAESVLARVADTVGAVRAPEVRALLGEVATELYRLTRRAEQLAARSSGPSNGPSGGPSRGPSSELDLLRRTAHAAPALLERLRRMAARLDDLDAALEGQSEGELMQSIARLERAAAAPGADRPALAAARRDLEATLEHRHATEQERARLSAKLCQLLGHLRLVYRQAAEMKALADGEALAIEAATAELDAMLVASP